MDIKQECNSSSEPRNHTTETPARQHQRTPGAFGNTLVTLGPFGGTHGAHYSVMTRQRPGGSTVVVKDSRDRFWETLGKKVRAGARIR